MLKILDKVMAICPNFEWLCFRISDPIPNLDHLQTDFFWTIQISDVIRFQIPTVLHPLLVKL